MNQHFANAAPVSHPAASRKTVAAAERRAKSVPTPDAVSAAWYGLPRDAQDRIGSAAVAFGFYSWLSSDVEFTPGERWLSVDGVGEASLNVDDAMHRLERAVEYAVPTLCGTDMIEPAWAREAADGLDLDGQVGTAAEREFQTAAVTAEGRASPRQAAVALHALAFPAEVALLTPVLLGIALHKRTWQALCASSAFLNATGRADRMATGWTAVEAETEALCDLLEVPCTSRADAMALLAHLRFYLAALPDHPTRDDVPETNIAAANARAADLELFHGRAVVGDPEPMLEEIEASRAAIDALLSADVAALAGSDEWSRLQGVAQATADHLMRVPCGDLSGARALAGYAQWFTGQMAAADADTVEWLETDTARLAARAGDLAVGLGAHGD